MPIYDYQCQDPGCGHQFELRQGFDADSVTRCPVCQGQASRLFHPVPIIFKGSGWYVTDHARQSPTVSSSSNGTETSSSPAKAEAPSNGTKPSSPAKAEVSSNGSTSKVKEKETSKTP